MRISTRSRYGLRAMAYLARAGRVCSAKEISQKEKIPFDFLEKIFSKLQKENLVKSQKGAKGGYLLARPPQKISVGEILRVLEGKEIFSVFCRKKRCLSQKKCPIRDVWEKIQEVLNSTLEETTLLDLTKRKI